MARQAVTSRQINRLVGAEDVIKEINKRIGPEAARALKPKFAIAAKPIQDQARRNIEGLPVSPHAKQLLSAQVVSGEGPARFPNAVVAMYQFSRAAKQANPQGDTILNPYWVEFGTSIRHKQNGASTGRMEETPYFRPAVVQARPEVASKLVDGLRDVLVEGKV